ncbi:MAG TPA: hypothetical protein PLD47_03860 [Aggregatilineales bacterium]|nr:hypothetical protein [Aggregatilineales bacterium]
MTDNHHNESPEQPKKPTFSLPKPPAWMIGDDDSDAPPMPRAADALRVLRPMVDPSDVPSRDAEAPLPSPASAEPSAPRTTETQTPAAHASPLRPPALKPAQPSPAPPTSPPTSTPLPSLSAQHPAATPYFPPRRSTPVPEVIPPPPPLVEVANQDQPFADVSDDSEDDPFAEDVPLLVDPALAYIVLVILSVLGAGSLAPDVRYTLLWSGIAVVGVWAITADDLPIERPTLRDILVGVAYGLIVALPLLIVGGVQLKRLSLEVFGTGSDAGVVQTLAFVVPMAETLFFRGALQAARGVFVTGAAAGVWSLALFLPVLNVIQYPLVVVVMGVSFLFLGFLYSYLRERIGFFTAWACQVVVSVLLLGAARVL